MKHKHRMKKYPDKVEQAAERRILRFLWQREGQTMEAITKGCNLDSDTAVVVVSELYCRGMLARPNNGQRYSITDKGASQVA